MVYLTIVTAAKNVSVMSDLYPRMISSSISASPYSLKFHVRENTFLITGSPKISIKGAAIAIIAGVIGSFSGRLLDYLFPGYIESGFLPKSTCLPIPEAGDTKSF
jgi:hypothetical protein